LSHDKYDLRARDGKLICTVARAKAEQGIASGDLELWNGPSGACLRAVGSSYPAGSRHSNIVPDSRHTLHGKEATAVNPAALYRHNAGGCQAYRGVVKGIETKAVIPESGRGSFAGFPSDLRTTARRSRVVGRPIENEQTGALLPKADRRSRIDVGLAKYAPDELVDLYRRVWGTSWKPEDHPGL
jgi:hypothetical protein